MEKKNYGTGKLEYGVSGMVGNLIICKYRVRESTFIKIEEYFKKLSIPYSILKQNTKNGITYTHFSFAVTYLQLQSVKIIIRKQRIIKIENEIEQLNAILAWEL